MTNKAVLIILDGYGIAPATPGNAITTASKPNLDKLFAEYPHSQLIASGLDVGLPEGQMGNSEVGHTNIGAGRVVFQILPKMTKEIEDGDFFKNPVYIKCLDDAVANDKPLHVLGLISTGGVHSHLKHVFGMLDMAKQRGVKQVYVHCFLDGRDVPPTSGAGFVKQLHEKCNEVGNAKIATIQGRFWGMDRDKRWDRVEKGYNCIVCGEGNHDDDPVHAVETSYQTWDEAGEKYLTDEFMLPTVIAPEGVINRGDSVVFMNFRPDRAREMTWALNLPEFDGFERKKKVYPLSYVCTAQYDENLTLPIAYPPEVIENTIGDLVSSLGLKQFRVAETEKYAHVTFFFNGGREAPFDGEDRVLVASPKVTTYDLQPEMSAYEVKDKLVENIKKNIYDFIVVNFANGDMVGHTGVYNAIAKAVVAVDNCVRDVIEAAKATGYEAIIIADHGNADNAINADGTPNTAHSLNPVPCIYVTDNNSATIKDGRLADVAPTILHIMGLEQPSDMTGENLICD